MLCASAFTGHCVWAGVSVSVWACTRVRMQLLEIRPDSRDCGLRGVKDQVGTSQRQTDASIERFVVIFALRQCHLHCGAI